MFDERKIIFVWHVASWDLRRKSRNCGFGFTRVFGWKFVGKGRTREKKNRVANFLSLGYMERCVGFYIVTWLWSSAESILIFETIARFFFFCIFGSLHFFFYLTSRSWVQAKSVDFKLNYSEDCMIAINNLKCCNLASFWNFYFDGVTFAKMVSHIEGRKVKIFSFSRGLQNLKHLYKNIDQICFLLLLNLSFWKSKSFH